MSDEFPQDIYPCLPSEEEIMKMNDDSDGKSSNQNNSENDQDLFEEIEDIFEQQNNQNGKRKISQKQKISELQLTCARLFKTTSFLTKRIQYLEIQLSEQADNELDLQQVTEYLLTLEQLVQSYKSQLTKYREKQLSQTNKRNAQLLNLRNSIQLLKIEKAQLQRNKEDKEDIQQQNEKLQNTNINLLNQIENLQKELSDMHSTKSYSRKQKPHNRTAFDDQIQAELEILIEKLMNELQIERNNNKKSIQELKRMQLEIIQFQRQLASKNNTIYSLEMSQLKSIKGSPKNFNAKSLTGEHTSDRLAFKGSQKHQNFKSKSDRNTILKNINLSQLLSENVDISEKERYIIASKITNFYIKKYQSEDYEPIDPNKLMICSYNKVNSSLMAIKKMPSSSVYAGQMSQKTLSLNLGILLSNLIIQASYDSQLLDENIRIIDEGINGLIQQQHPCAQSVQQLKNTIDEILKVLD